MAISDLRDFIELLNEKGELHVIKEKVSPILEITEIADRVVKEGGPALIFKNVEGSKFPVFINGFGTYDRVKLALGISDFKELEEKIENFIKLEEPRNFLDKIKFLPRLNDMGKIFPKLKKSGKCKEVIKKKDFSILDFPILKCWPQDGGRFITFPLIFSKDPISGKKNCGMYRLQVFDENTTGMHWQKHKDGAENYRRSKEINKRMEVAVTIGNDPAVLFASILPLPKDVNEMIFAGLIKGEGVEMVKCETVDIEVPANSEIVLEGYVDNEELREEGPFGDHTGFYSLEDLYPVFHITCITHRKNPIYHTTIVGKPPMEDCFLGKGVERVMLPLMKMQLPEIVDINMPCEGVFHNLMIVSIKKRYPGHARKIMNAIWGMGQAMFTKCILVVDDDVNVQDLKEVAWVSFNNIDPKRDVMFSEGPVDSLDHASPFPDFGSKIGVDATKKWDSEGFGRKWPDKIEMSEDIIDLVNKKWKNYWK